MVRMRGPMAIYEKLFDAEREGAAAEEAYAAPAAPAGWGYTERGTLLFRSTAETEPGRGSHKTAE